MLLVKSSQGCAWNLSQARSDIYHNLPGSVWSWLVGLNASDNKKVWIILPLNVKKLCATESCHGQSPECFTPQGWDWVQSLAWLCWEGTLEMQWFEQGLGRWVLSWILQEMCHRSTELASSPSLWTPTLYTKQAVCPPPVFSVKTLLIQYLVFTLVV